MVFAKKGGGAWAAAGMMIVILAGPGARSRAAEETLDEMKARVAHLNVGDRPALCLHIAEKELQATKEFYSSNESEKAEAALKDLVTYAELDRDAAIQSHKHEKQSEIALRKMARRLDDVKHTVSRDEQERLQRAIDRLQTLRDDLMTAMFAGGKK